jgi:hypothetical protein
MNSVLVLHGFVEREVETDLASNDHSRNLEQAKARSIKSKVSGTTSLASLTGHLVDELEESILSLQIAMLTNIVEGHL